MILQTEDLMVDNLTAVNENELNSRMHTISVLNKQICISKGFIYNHSDQTQDLERFF